MTRSQGTVLVAGGLWTFSVGFSRPFEEPDLQRLASMHVKDWNVHVGL